MAQQQRVPRADFTKSAGTPLQEGFHAQSFAYFYVRGNTPDGPIYRQIEELTDSCCARSVANVQTSDYVFYVALRSGLGDAEFLRDLIVRFTLFQQRMHFALTLRQAEMSRSGNGAAGAALLQQNAKRAVRLRV